MNQAVLDLIGNTPLIRLAGPSAATGCEIYGKAEFLNPGGSVKDRTALGIVRAAEKSGELKKGGTIVEGSAGNTGIGLALVGAALGHHVITVMPRNQSFEKRQGLVAMGCEIVEVDPAPYSSAHHFTHVSKRLAEKMNAKSGNVFWANQFDNPANKAMHCATTGVEIWEQTGGKIDGFICSVGTGGTLAGIAQALRAQQPGIAIGLADTASGALFNYYTKGEMRSAGTSITEGVGLTRLSDQIKHLKVDYAFQAQDADFLPILFELVQKEGLSLGGSSGVNVYGAMQLARALGPGKTIVTLLCDSGSRYAGRLYNTEYLAARNLPVPPWAFKG